MARQDTRRRNGSRITTMAANGALPEDAAALYPGEVMHARLKPFGHRFTYRVFSLLIDLDRLDEAGRLSRLFSVNRANLVSFHEADHTERAARIVLLAYPRILGYVFNPISVFFAYDAENRPLAMIYSVRNTFGERHIYVAPVRDGERNDAGIRQERRKVFHVSPFIGMNASYRFRVLPPGETVRLRIHECEDGSPVLAAAFAGDRHELTDSSLAACLLRIPFMTWKIVAGIHWEALKLWLKGAQFHRSPKAPELVSYGTEQAPFQARE